MTDEGTVLPPEMVEQLEAAVDLYEISLSQAIARAYKAGADAELEACCEWLRSDPVTAEVIGREARYLDHDLKAARRPTLPSLKKQAIDCLSESYSRGLLRQEAADTIRRALEALPE